MEKIRQWSAAVSAVSVLSGVLISLLPENMNKKYFKLITSIVIIYTAMQPLIGSKSIDFNIDEFLKDNYQVSESLDRYAVSSVISSAEKAIEDLFYEKAENNGFSWKFDCECFLSDGEISVKSIHVNSFVNESEKLLIEKWSEEFGFNKSVVIFEGEDNEN